MVRSCVEMVKNKRGLRLKKRIHLSSFRKSTEVSDHSNSFISVPPGPHPAWPVLAISQKQRMTKVWQRGFDNRHHARSQSYRTTLSPSPSTYEGRQAQHVIAARNGYRGTGAVWGSGRPGSMVATAYSHGVGVPFHNRQDTSLLHEILLLLWNTSRYHLKPAEEPGEHGGAQLLQERPPGLLPRSRHHGGLRRRATPAGSAVPVRPRPAGRDGIRNLR
jgi:hypothetical protein